MGSVHSIVALESLVLLFCLSACSGPKTKKPDYGKPMSAAEAAKVTEEVRTYYSKRDIGGGWNVYNFRTKGQDVFATLSMSSEQQACGFSDDTKDAIDQMESIACPYDGDYIWKELKPKQDIVLETSCYGSVFNRLSCRHVHPSGSLLATPESTLP